MSASRRAARDALRHRALTLESVRFGYVPYDSTLTQPGDRRRFVWWAKHRGIHFEIAEPAGDYDIVYLTPRADISVWDRYEGPAKLVYEMVDAYLAVSRWSLRGAARGLAKFAVRENRRLIPSYRRGIEAMCRRADAVACGSEEQRETILRYCPNVHVILDALDDVVHDVKSDYRVGDTINLVWEGLPENLRGFATVVPSLKAVAADHPLAVHVVTALEHARALGRFLKHPTQDLIESVFGDLAPSVVLHEWDALTLSRIANTCDAAVIPLDLSDPLAAGKPANKLIGFWRMGLPTITSATPSYRREMEAAGVEAACATADEWEATLRRTATDEAFRRDNAQRGLAHATAHHTEAGLPQQWDAMFQSVLDWPERR